MDAGHASFQGRFFCSVEEGPGGRTAQQWLQEQQAAAEAEAAPEEPPPQQTVREEAETLLEQPGPSSSQIRFLPTRCTLYRRRVALEKDVLVLLNQKEESKPGDPCQICGHARTLEEGHAYFKGQFFCAMEEGPGGRTARQWLEQQRGPEDVGRIPRTTAWNLQKKWERELADEGRPEGKKRKPHKLRICKLCGQPQQKDYGHSQYDGEHVCAVYAGKTVELWLAQKRTVIE